MPGEGTTPDPFQWGDLDESYGATWHETHRINRGSQKAASLMQDGVLSGGVEAVDDIRFVAVAGAEPDHRDGFASYFSTAVRFTASVALGFLRRQ